MVKTLKGNIPWNKGKKTGQIPWNKGKKTSLKTKQKQSDAHKGKKLSKETKQKMSISRKGRIFSIKTKEKLSLSKLGPLNPQWKGGITPQSEIIRKSDKYKQWRTTVFNRDKFTCQITELIISGEMEAHHINNFSSCEEKRFDIDNGITIHKDIHTLFHKKYGYFNNNLEQLKEFKEEYKK